VRRGVKTFSWLIYRMTSPVIRRLFMAPRNIFACSPPLFHCLPETCSVSVRFARGCTSFA